MKSLVHHQALIDGCKHVNLEVLDSPATGGMARIEVLADRWYELVSLVREQDYRFCAYWLDNDTEVGWVAFCCVELAGHYLLLTTRVKVSESLASISTIYVASDRPERHARDLFGLEFKDAMDQRRWTRHQGWRRDQHPLRTGASVTRPTQPQTDESYTFTQAQGASVVEIPVGPVHAGIIEPGHFRFQSVGETCLNLEQHLGYVHKGIEKIAVGRDLAGLVRLAGRVSGDTTVAHGWAACQAVERGLGLAVPTRALWLRAIMLERERISHHLGDIGAICNDVGFSFAPSQLSRLREEVLRCNAGYFSHRLMMDQCCVGGVLADLNDQHRQDMLVEINALQHEFIALLEQIEASETLEDRLMTTGRLVPELAEQLATLGYVGKASGHKVDVRINSPYPPYDQYVPKMQSYRAGDVAARARIRADEIIDSCGLLSKLLGEPPEGDISVPIPALKAVEGVGMVEGFRGEIITYVRLDNEGRVARFFPRDPSWLNWPALELLMQGNIVPDFPVCNKSVNGSYSGQDL